MLLCDVFFEQNRVICRFPTDCWAIIKCIFSLHQVQLENTACELCQTKCKSKSGLKRHKTVKHKDTSNPGRQDDGEQHRDLGFAAYSRIAEKAKLTMVEGVQTPNILCYFASQQLARDLRPKNKKNIKTRKRKIPSPENQWHLSRDNVPVGEVNDIKKVVVFAFLGKIRHTIYR